MRLRTCALGLLALAAPAQLSCDSVTAGQAAPDTGPPVLMRILVQDASSSGRQVATDLLDEQPPLACSDTSPCPAGDAFSHPPCDLATGLCPDPLNAAETPAVLGTGGRDQIRVVLSKPLAPALETATVNPTGTSYALADPTLVGVYDASGKELRAVKYWDPSGSPTVTSNLFTSPYGPALVVKPQVDFLPFHDYSVRLRPEGIVDAQGQAVAQDVNGDPVATSYGFTTEGLHAAGTDGDDLKDPKNDPDGAIDTGDVLILRASAPFDPSTLQVTVERDGQPVEITATPDIPIPASGPCRSVVGRSSQIDVFRTSGGTEVPWDEGDYSLTVSAVSADDPGIVFSLDPFGKTPYAGVPFAVRAGVDPDGLYSADKYRLPSECLGPAPTDMWMPGLSDMAASPPPDGGADDMNAGFDGAPASVDGGEDGGADGGVPDLAAPPVDGGTRG